MKVEDCVKGIYGEIAPALSSFCQEEFDVFVDKIMEAENIFVSGFGRTGYMMRGFAMRLMQNGLNAYMVGDTTTPGAKKGDLLIIGSGSGETTSLKIYLEKARKLDVDVIVITTQRESFLAKNADAALIVDVKKASHKTDDGLMKIVESDNKGQKMLLGSCSELCMLIATEILNMMVFERSGETETSMMFRHATFE